jgi:hypothetical protein
LNLQSFRNQILSLARLPFRHARNRHQIAPGTAESQAFVAFFTKAGDKHQAGRESELWIGVETMNLAAAPVNWRPAWAVRGSAFSQRRPPESLPTRPTVQADGSGFLQWRGVLTSPSAQHETFTR